MSRTRRHVDALVEWYAKNRPGQKIDLRVNLARCTCEKFCTQLNHELFYRGHRVIPLNATVHCGQNSAAPEQRT
jgi:uncharacterized Fe-S cluster protein YjdI